MIRFPSQPNEKAIYFHEDDYCQIEILPLSLWDYCIEEIKKISNFAANHQAEIGWTNIYLREEAPKSFAELSISINELKEKIEKTMFTYSRVTTGYSTYVEECQNCLAWGIGEGDFTLFVNSVNDKIINAMWLDFGIVKNYNFPLVLETFRNLPNFNQLMIADWRWEQVANIGDEKSLENYLALHADSD